MRRRATLVVAGIVVLAGAAVAVALVARGCGADGREEVPAAASTPQRATFVGRQACAECHAAESERWAGSDHDLAMQPADERTVLGDFDGATFEHFGVTTTFFRRDGGFFVRTDGPDGTLQEYPIAYAFGVDPLQQYLVEFPGGRYQVLGVCWDSRPAAEGGGRWFHIYGDEPIPHDDELHWTRPSQTWNFMCAECHSTDLRKNYDAATGEYDTTWSEIDVSCEACHGPGSRHVAWARARPAGAARRPGDDPGLDVRLRDDDGGFWVIDPQKGTAARTVPRASHAQVETCARCHARRYQFHADYVYGRPLLDTHRPRVLVDPLYFADGQIREEVYEYGSFLQSRMHRQGVTCSDCHDPHSLDLHAIGNVLCARCHAPDRFDTRAHHFHEPGTAGASCVECHMPSRTYMVVDPRRDHGFRVPRPDLSLELGVPNACNGCHEDKTARWAADQVAAWYGPGRASTPHFAQAIYAGGTGAPGAAGLLAALAGNAEEPAIARATAVLLLSGDGGAEARSAIEGASMDPDALVRAAAMDALGQAAPEDRLRLGLPRVDDPVRAVRISAARALAPVATGIQSADRREALDRAVAEYIAAELTNADRPEAHLNLGNFYGELGRFDEAEASYRRGLAIDPAHAEAYVNLADLYRAAGRDEEGERLLTEAVAAMPDRAALHHALGLVYARQQRYAEATDALAAAARLEPENPRFAYVYAVALHSSGDTAEALAELERAHEIHPSDTDILSALVAFYRDAGQPRLAARYAEKLKELGR